ncbi:ATP-binding cassette domain-containing protein [Prochlorococcus sp. AH-736-N17]|nr:ATP-binding cassette domain-containing protein [Prochlorococcus sp. AH-736-N17]MDA9729327.1 ATP-binding cassette domain-containing protein [Prochlorococcus sp. AH-736-N17]
MQQTNLNFKTQVKGIWKNLSFKRKKQIFLLTILMLLSALSEVLSLASILPFLTVITNPELISKFGVLNNIFEILGINSIAKLRLIITLFFITIVLLAAIIRLLNLTLNAHLAALINSDFSCKVYKNILFKPYYRHLELNSSDFITTTTFQISLTGVVIQCILQLVTSAFISIGLIIALLIINYQIAISCSFIFGIFYITVAFYLRKKLSINSKKESEAAKLQVRVIQEGLGSIRNIILDKTHEVYQKSYIEADKPMRTISAQNQVLALFPKYVLEAIGICIIAITSYLLTTKTGGDKTIPVIGAFALGIQRLLPSIQQGYSSFTFARANKNAVSDVLTNLEDSENLYYPIPKSKRREFNDSLKLKNISFSYKRDSNLVLKNLNLDIKKGDKIGIIGKTGSGKSTLLDIIMCLLPPTKGNFFVDNKDIYQSSTNENLINWQSNISHVPQNIYLADCTIAENIALGTKKKDIDINRVMRAAQKAQISNFIESCSDKYNHIVGERGMMISGGQRQRIGIARALYKMSNVIIFDEATSALDQNTEKNIMNEIFKLSDQLTLIIVAHRTKTLDNCSRIIEIKNGTII